MVNLKHRRRGNLNFGLLDFALYYIGLDLRSVRGGNGHREFQVLIFVFETICGAARVETRPEGP